MFGVQHYNSRDRRTPWEKISKTTAVEGINETHSYRDSRLTSKVPGEMSRKILQVPKNTFTEVTKGSGRFQRTSLNTMGMY